MKVRTRLLLLTALTLGAVLVAMNSPNVAADAITLMTDKSIHAFGESVAITVSYMGGVHGDVKLSIEDSSGAMMNSWTWGHASSDPFQQSVSYTPTSPGAYTVRAVHQPHHMEPPASSTAQIAFWSARILNLQYSAPVDASKPIDIALTVSYYFTQPTQVKLELWSNTENKNLGTLTQTMNGQGTTILILTNIVFTSVQDQDVTARIYYQSPSSGWINDVTGGSYSTKVTVVPEFEVTPAILLLLSFLTLGLLRRRITRKTTE